MEKMTNPQTICLLNDSFPPLIDGVANAVCNYAEQITASGSRAVVLTPSHPQASDDGFSYPVIRYPSIDLRKKTGYMAGVPFSPDMARRIANDNVSLLHSHCPIASTLLGRALRRITNAPLILTYHTKFDVDIANTIRSKLLQHGSIHALVENISACDEVWTVSQGAADNLRALGYTGDVIIMPNGVDLPKGRVSDDAMHAATAAYDLPEGVPVFLYVGRMMWYKGIRLILDALAMLRLENCDFRMVFIGDGMDRREIEQYANDCGAGDKCIFTGAIYDREAIRAWYCRSNLFLFPSSFDTNGLVVREAAACCLPAVLIRGSAAAEGVTHGENGFLMDENAQSLHALLLSLIDKSEKMAAVGQTAADELYLSWEASVKMAMDRYQVVIENYKRGDYPPTHNISETVLRANAVLMEELGNLESVIRSIGQPS